MPSDSNQRILVRGVNWLGDAVMTTPALQRLREARPDAHITLLTPAGLADLWQNHPAIDAVLTFEKDESVWSVGRRLRSERFDITLILPNSPRSALESWLAGIPQRIGHAHAWRNWFLTQVVPARTGAAPMRKRSESEINRLIRENAAPTVYPASAHHIHQYLHLASALGAKPEPLPTKLAVSAEATAAFENKFKLTSGQPKPSQWLALNAGAEYGPAKRWPEESFIEAAIQIQKRTGCGWIVFGGRSELEAGNRIVAAIKRAGESNNPRVLNLAGMTTLAELCAGLKLCRVLLTNDSGPMHVAAALGTPVVAMFGSTSPELTAPGLPGDSRHHLLCARVPCSPCFLRECPIDFRCMTGISVEQVVGAVLRVAKTECW